MPSSTSLSGPLGQGGTAPRSRAERHSAPARELKFTCKSCEARGARGTRLQTYLFRGIFRLLTHRHALRGRSVLFLVLARVRQPSATMMSPKAGGRPRTSASGSGHGARRAAKVSIRDIVSNDAGKRPTAKNLIKGLEENVRKVLETKRVEFDRVHFLVGKKRKELEELKLQLADLQKDGKALGLEKFPDPRTRLQPVKAISTRPVFSRDTNLDEMVKQLEEKKAVIEKVIHRGMIYDHMRQRLMTERVEEKKVNGDLRVALREQQLRNAEVKRRDIKVSEALGAAQRELAQLKSDVDKDVKLWQSEIEDREAWVKQKAKFEGFVARQLQRQREIELEVKGDMGADDEESLKAKSAASMFANRHMQKKLSSKLKSSAGVERRYEEAFRKIGVKLDNLDPQTVIQTCLAQDEIRKDLLRKRAAEEERVAELTRQLANAQQELQETEIQQQRTTNRLLADAEKQLNEAEKKLEAEKSEFQFMQSTVQPVKIGIQHLAKKVLDVQVDLSDVGEIEWVMDQVQARLAKIIEDTRADLSTMRPASPALDSTGAPAPERRHSLSLAGDVEDGIAGADWLMSPHNLRVRSHREIEAEEAKAEAGDLDSKGKKKKKRGGAGQDLGIGGDDVAAGAFAGEDSESDDESSKVKDRSALKAEARRRLQREHKAFKKRQKGEGGEGRRGGGAPSGSPSRRTSNFAATR